MGSNYKKYTADRLLNDDYFLQSESHPTDESRRFWDGLACEDRRLEEEIRNARLILERIKSRVDGPELREEEKTELWSRIERVNNRGRLRRRSSLIAAVSSAAAVVALLLLLNLSRDKGADYTAMMESALQHQDTSGNVQLILSDNKSFNVEGKESKIEYEATGGIRINSVKIASAEGASRKPVYGTLIVPKGKRSSLTLADGTKIWVNSDSKVIYPTKFEGTDREIFVEGEVYLDVFHNELMPFTVKTGHLDVRVLGTQFNVLSLAGESYSEVVLIDGQVEVKAGDNPYEILVPGELYRYDTSTETGSVSKVEVADHVAWKDGYYPFGSQPLDVVLGKIARYYGLQIEWDENVSRLTCSGKLDLREGPAEVLSFLEEAAPITIREKDGTYFVKVKP